VKASIFLLCALCVRDALRILGAIVALNPFFAQSGAALGNTPGVSFDFAILVGETKILIPPGLFVWSGLAFAQWKTNGRWAFYVGYVAVGAMVLHLLMVYFVTANLKTGLGFLTIFHSLDLGFVGLLLLVLTSLLFSLKRFDENPKTNETTGANV
jgi:hypothetical protein